MGQLANLLKYEFMRNCPSGWSCRGEVPLLTDDLVLMLGYNPRADILLENRAESRRLWIEFEVSRADPVANHAKFATSHLFRPLEKNDYFLAMVSPHVSRGRRNLAFNTLTIMRILGMNAFQTVLLPETSPNDIKRLNNTALDRLLNEGIDVVREIERAIEVTTPTDAGESLDLYLAPDISQVLWNLHSWNRCLVTEPGRTLWGNRTITYFVFDPRFGLFAPSKFCAYLPYDQKKQWNLRGRNEPLAMTVESIVAWIRHLWMGTESSSSLDSRFGHAGLQRYRAK